MQAIFTYGGTRKSGLTPKTILFGTLNLFAPPIMSPAQLKQLFETNAQNAAKEAAYKDAQEKAKREVYAVEVARAKTEGREDFFSKIIPTLEPVSQSYVPSAPASSRASTAPGFNLTSLLIPVGAGLAALYFLKGN